MSLSEQEAAPGLTTSILTRNKKLEVFDGFFSCVAFYHRLVPVLGLHGDGQIQPLWALILGGQAQARLVDGELVWK